MWPLNSFMFQVMLIHADCSDVMSSDVIWCHLMWRRRYVTVWRDSDVAWCDIMLMWQRDVMMYVIMWRCDVTLMWCNATLVSERDVTAWPDSRPQVAAIEVFTCSLQPVFWLVRWVLLRDLEVSGAQSRWWPLTLQAARDLRKGRKTD